MTLHNKLTMKAIGHFPTHSGANYIGKLCRHFIHKIQATYEGNQGEAIFPKGICKMSASSDLLVFEIEASDAESCEKIKGVIDRHLVKFAYKETTVLHWVEQH